MFEYEFDLLDNPRSPPSPRRSEWYTPEEDNFYPPLEYTHEDIYGERMPDPMKVMVQHWSLGAFARSWEAHQNRKTSYFNAGPPMEDPECPVCETQYQLTGSLYWHIQMNHPWYDVYGDDLDFYGWLQRGGVRAKTKRDHCRPRQTIFNAGFGPSWRNAWDENGWDRGFHLPGYMCRNLRDVMKTEWEDRLITMKGIKPKPVNTSHIVAKPGKQLTKKQQAEKEEYIRNNWDIHGHNPIPALYTRGACARWKEAHDHGSDYFKHVSNNERDGYYLDKKDYLCPVCDRVYPWTDRERWYWHMQSQHPWYDLYGGDLTKKEFLALPKNAPKPVVNHRRQMPTNGMDLYVYQQGKKRKASMMEQGLWVTGM
ncbi:hypothetical protein BZA77DRAFT_322970 [Pyronema omphalodes]|nr:hypothetical protein BZA77DRAFT_322970 [Pyronema omphalodes]